MNTPSVTSINVGTPSAAGAAFLPLGLTPARTRTSRKRPADLKAESAPNRTTTPPPAPLVTPPLPATTDKIEILIVDDAPEKLLALEAALTELDLQIVKAYSGREALRLVLQRDFAVILLDVNMPAMDGFETAQLLRQRPANAHTPIIFVTAFSTGETEIFRGYSLGAVDYLFTPVTPDVLRSKVSVFVELAKRNREIARQADALRRAEEARLQQQLEQAAARIEWETRRNHFFRLSIELLAITDYRAVFTQTNPTWERALGYTADELSGRPILSFIHPDDQARMNEALANVTQAESPLYFETRFRATAGDYRWLGWTIAPFAAEGLLYIFARDITERRQREEEINRLNDSLQRTATNLQTMNQELEAFAYSLAHDLRTPLRAITTYSEVLLTDEAAGLQPEATRIVQSVHRNSVRMLQLMDDFLGFFRVARKEPKRELVNVHALVREAITATQPDKGKRHVDFVIGDLPAVKGDSAMLLQVFVNLLSNSVKFTSTRELARIEIGCDTACVPPVFRVRDNGVGFDMKYSNKLFGVFERLHARESFDGTGIGLATVQKIVQRHGGAVWAEAVVDQGATFYFTLPD
ncbi:MAG: response regulator [Opitutae bacterium]|nr:response regulator [Opitutae bacterium]